MARQLATAETEQLAREIAQRTGEPPAQAIIAALQERLAWIERQRQESDQLFAAIMAIGKHCASLPVLDPRSPDELLGYDEHGLPH